MQNVISTVVVSPDTLLSYALVHLLRAAHYRLVGVTPSFTELCISAGEGEPDLFILALPDDVANLAGVAHLRHQSKLAKIVVLSDRLNPSTCAQVLRAGAVAYLSRSISKDEFVKFLGRVAAGEVVVSPELLMATVAPRIEAVVSQPPTRRSGAQSFDETVSRLSPREAEVLRCIVDGDSNKHIGRHFEIAETTVKVHIKSILRKINAHNRTQAAIWAVDHLNRDAHRAYSSSEI
jgi:two-component system, NarL family, nitrate/nitrite response regulator NarL